MRFAAFSNGEREGLAVAGSNGEFRGLLSGEAQYPGPLDALVRQGRAALDASAFVLQCGPVVDLDQVTFFPPLPAPGKIICVGLNYVDRSLESGFTPPGYPTIFSRFASSLVPAGAPIIRPRASTQLDYEGEMVAVMGAGGRHIPEQSALNHVIGYSIFNVLPVAGTLVMLFPLWGLIEPRQPWPYNLLPWAALGVLALSVVYGLVIGRMSPGLEGRIGAYVADQ
jgi:hypothetical protein